MFIYKKIKDKLTNFSNFLGNNCFLEYYKNQEKIECKKNTNENMPNQIHVFYK